jgi:hypothetical protein
MKKDNDEIRWKDRLSQAQSCKPQGGPDYLLPRGPFSLLQTTTRVLIVEETGDTFA